MTTSPEYDLSVHEKQSEEYDFFLDSWTRQYKSGKTCPRCLSKKLELDDDGCYCGSCHSVWELGEIIEDMREAWIESAIKELKNDQG